ncbi:uncharacterized protein LOC108162945 [Drosophila miranda]|uniref:uncharacterized protein LOC108162945 n=1 Tax=Drosophila miranda TaxID=7229 RepID=UPI0007E7248E|nr:uncharacterized protein LOC108162945 [Drosophila miranda]
MTQRLNLPHILQNQLQNEHRVQGGGIFKLGNKRDKTAMKTKPKEQIPNDTYFSEKPDVIKTFDKMVSTIHSTMKATQPPRRAIPTIPAPIAVIPNAPPQKTFRKRSKSVRSRSLRSRSASRGRSVTRSRSSRFKGGGSSSNRGSTTGVVMTGKSKNLPLSAMKADLDQKVMVMMRRGLNDTGGKSFHNQRRIREVLQQKVMLEQMLLQHKRLQRDRQTIALDIQRMRHDLEKIRHKLDTSLQGLTATRTITGTIAKAKKNSGIKVVSLASGRRPFSAASPGRRPFRTASPGRRLMNAASPSSRSSGIVHKRRMSDRSPSKRRGSGKNF